MTNEEAIKILINSAFLATVSKYEDIEEAIRMAVSALGAIDQIQWERDLAIKQLHDLGYGLGEKPREDNSSSDKLIKASDAVDVVAKHSALYGDGEISTDDGEALLYGIMSEIMNLPSAQPEHSKNAPQKQPNPNMLGIKTEETCEDVISRQVAIDEIRKDKIGSNSLKIMGMLGNGNEALTVNMTCDRHIQLLKNLPSAQTDVPDTNVGDMISRQAAIDEALSFLVEYCGAAFDEDMQKKLLQRLKLLPSAQPEIIRCKDCVHHIDGFFCRQANHHTSDKDHCASVFRAERREE